MVVALASYMCGLQAAQVEWLRAVQQDENFTMMGLRLRQLPGHAVPDTTWDPEARCLVVLSREGGLGTSTAPRMPRVVGPEMACIRTRRRVHPLLPKDHALSWGCPG